MPGLRFASPQNSMDLLLKHNIFICIHIYSLSIQCIYVCAYVCVYWKQFKRYKILNNMYCMIVVEFDIISTVKTQFIQFPENNNV